MLHVVSYIFEDNGRRSPYRVALNHSRRTRIAAKVVYSYDLSHRRLASTPAGGLTYIRYGTMTTSLVGVDSVALVLPSLGRADYPVAVRPSSSHSSCSMHSDRRSLLLGTIVECFTSAPSEVRRVAGPVPVGCDFQNL